MIVSMKDSILRALGRPGVEPAFGTPRHKDWRKESRAFLAENPTCWVTGRPAAIVHHIVPFWLDPSLELEWYNFAPFADQQVHLFAGHGGNWRCYRPRLREWCRAERAAREDMKADLLRFAAYCRAPARPPREGG